MISTHGIYAGAGVAAVLAAVGTGWRQVRGFSQYIMSSLVLQRELRGDKLSLQVVKHLREKYKRLPSGIAKFATLHEVVDDRPFATLVPYELPHHRGLWRGPRGTFYVNTEGRPTIMSLRYISDPKGLIEDAIATSDARALTSTDDIRIDEFQIIKIMGTAGEGAQNYGTSVNRVKMPKGGDAVAEQPESDYSWEAPQKGVDKSFMYEDHRFMKDKNKESPLRGLFFQPEVHRMFQELERWFKRSDWYRSHGIPWRTGVLMYGPGGTGKSSLAKAIAQTLKIPLYQYFLNTLTDKEFVSSWSDMATPCVAALEDFDTVFHGRESTTVHKSLSFECVLNQISGISSLNGVLLVVTTNNIEHIDPALGRVDENGKPTRPGRIDTILHMGNTTEQQRRDIAHYVLEDMSEDLIEDLVKRHNSTTAAQFQSVCINTALENLPKR